MQEIEMVDDGASRISDRRLRKQSGTNEQALNCPRCDSLNTKFCYYNNYNLSQPRHFCKACRRYWTKGGVLRKVPVGGGCRKANRTAKPKPSSTSSSVVVVVSPTDVKENSSSESSSLTATATAGEAASGNTSFNSAPPIFNLVPECDFFASFIDQASGSMFPDIGELSSWEVELSTFVNDERERSDQDYLDQTAEVESDIFDLTGTVDQTYWTQSHWPEPDQAHHSAFNYLP